MPREARRHRNRMSLSAVWGVSPSIGQIHVSWLDRPQRVATRGTERRLAVACKIGHFDHFDLKHFFSSFLLLFHFTPLSPRPSRGGLVPNSSRRRPPTRCWGAPPKRCARPRPRPRRRSSAARRRRRTEAGRGRAAAAGRRRGGRRPRWPRGGRRAARRSYGHFATSIKLLDGYIVVVNRQIII